MSNLSRNDIQHLSHLARLEVTEEEAERYATQLTSVIGYVEQLQSVKATVDPELENRGVTGLENVLAADVPRVNNDPAAVNSEDLLAGAPLRSGRLLEVRAVLGGEESA